MKKRYGPKSLADVQEEQKEQAPTEMFHDAVLPAVNFLKFLDGVQGTEGQSAIIIDGNGATLYHAGMRAIMSVPTEEAN